MKPHLCGTRARSKKVSFGDNTLELWIMVPRVDAPMCACVRAHSCICCVCVCVCECVCVCVCLCVFVPERQQQVFHEVLGSECIRMKP
jgi:hypothetical protein